MRIHPSVRLQVFKKSGRPSVGHHTDRGPRETVITPPPTRPTKGGAGTAASTTTRHAPAGTVKGWPATTAAFLVTRPSFVLHRISAMKRVPIQRMHKHSR